MCEKSEDLNNLIRGDIYYGGSTYDGLKVNSTGPEFDLNLNFKFEPKHLELRGLGDDPNKKNFCQIELKKQVSNLKYNVKLFKSASHLFCLM